MAPSHSLSGANPAKRIRVLVADRNFMCSHLLAESLSHNSILDVTALASPPEILRFGAQKPDVALISMEFGSGDKKGLEVARTVRRSQPQVQIVILLDVSTRESVIASFRCGATGIFCRDRHPSELRSCVDRVSRGEVWARGEEVQYLLEAIGSTPSCDGIEAGKLNLLSKRERQVAEQAAQGHSNKEIADKLKLSEYTIKNYLYRVFEKLHISSRFELLFLLFNERSKATIGQAAEFDVAGLDHPIETYLKAAEDGFIAAQYLVGLAHLQGVGVEKNGNAAYYWLRMVEENSRELQQRTSDFTEELRSRMKREELEALEQSITSAVQRNRFMHTQPRSFLKGRAVPTAFGRSA